MALIGLDQEQTIVAVSTPPGFSARGIVRLSGPDCLAVAADVFAADASRNEQSLFPPSLQGRGRGEGQPHQDEASPSRASGFQPSPRPSPFKGEGKSRLASCRNKQAGFEAIAGLVRLGEGLELPAVAWRFRGPHSYTGQDMVELHLPGSPPLLELTVERLLAAGARAAEPGEFTLRAVLSGRIDLTEAEAVAELIGARSDGQLRAAMRLADGELARSVGAIHDSLADLLAEVEAGLDFADEAGRPIEFITTEQLGGGLADLRERLGRLAAGAGSLELLEHRPTVALVGLANAGKSTLLNRLSGLERALCSPLAGTTRDVLTAPLALADGEVQLLDAAGLDPAAADGIGRLAQDAALRAIRSADLLLVVLDATAPLAGQWATLANWGAVDRPGVAAVNKSDLLHCGLRNADCGLEGGVPGFEIPQSEIRGPQSPSFRRSIPVSALTGSGLAELKAALNEAVFAGADAGARAGEGLMLNARHRGSLADADAAIARVAALLADRPLDAVADLAALEMREASEQLGRITGRSLTDDLLERIFSRFCIGK